MKPNQFTDEVRALATPRQLEYIEAYEREQSVRGAGDALGINHSVIVRGLALVLKKAAQAGIYPQEGWDNRTPPGYINGKQTIQYGRNGEVERVWQRAQPALQEQIDAINEALEMWCDEVPRRAPLDFRALEDTSTDLLAVYPEGDPHWGMRVWGPETDGTDYDLDIASEEYRACIDYLVDQSPPTDVAISLNVGDNFHSDTPENRTRKGGHALNVDGRLSKVFDIVRDARCYKIERMLTKHRHVIVKEVPGNHDEVMSMFFTKALVERYRDVPEVEIVDSPNAWWSYSHGKVLLAATHGDKIKPMKMGQAVACDHPEEWGASVHRHIYTGHLHHLERLEEGGVVVEMLRTLAPRNEYEHPAGWRSKRGMYTRVYHKEHGEALTINASIELVKAMLQSKDDS